MYINRNIRASAEPDGGEVSIDPGASDLLMEAEDVAELLAEVTGQAVEATADDNSITFAVGQDEFVVEAEGDEEVVESATRTRRNARRVAASRAPATTTRRRTSARQVSASRVIRKVPSRK